MKTVSDLAYDILKKTKNLYYSIRVTFKTPKDPTDCDKIIKTPFKEIISIPIKISKDLSFYPLKTTLTFEDVEKAAGFKASQYCIYAVIQHEDKVYKISNFKGIFVIRPNITVTFERLEK